MAILKTKNAQHPVQMVTCPYCLESTQIKPASDYAPKYVRCSICHKRFIVERVQRGIQLLTLEEAPCTSDPDCRALEMAQGDEE
jgi:hypothetical protein